MVNLINITKKSFKVIILLLLSTFFCLFAFSGCKSNSSPIKYNDDEKEYWQIVVRNKFGDKKLDYYKFQDIENRSNPIKINLRYSGEIHNLDIIVMYKDTVCLDYTAILQLRFYSEDVTEAIVMGKNMADKNIPIQNKGRYYIEGAAVNISEINKDATAYGKICNFAIEVYVIDNVS